MLPILQKKDVDEEKILQKKDVDKQNELNELKWNELSLKPY